LVDTSSAVHRIVRANHDLGLSIQKTAGDDVLHMKYVKADILRFYPSDYIASRSSKAQTLPRKI
jgi:hypothetical protein